MRKFRSNESAQRNTTSSMQLSPCGEGGGGEGAEGGREEVGRDAAQSKRSRKRPDGGATRRLGYSVFIGGDGANGKEGIN